MKAKYFEHKKLFDAIDLKTINENGSRYYVTPDGNKYRSVTSVLSELSKDGIMRWRRKIGEEKAQKIATQAASRGTKLHTLLEKYINNEGEFLSESLPTTVDLFKTVKPIVDSKIQVVYGQEFPLYSKHLKTAGRCDLFCKFDNKKTILDFKTASKLKQEQWIENYFLQCTAYALMVEERYSIKVPQIAVLIAVENEHPQLFVKKASDYYKRVKEVFIDERV